jgi:hypothetical protein
MAAADDLRRDGEPFVLTLEMDGASFSRFDEFRRRYYPPARNMVPAHVTLFYRLPGNRGREIKALLTKTTRAQSQFEVVIGPARALERGVAFFLHSPQLLALREGLAAEWWPWLTDRDRMGYRPHVTIQNNVSPAEAMKTRRELEAARPPNLIQAVGLHLWRYHDGPLINAQLFPFR